MKQSGLHIAEGGAERLQKAVEAQVRKNHAEELSRAMDHIQRAEIEKNIREEIEREMKRVASPYSLWNS